MNRTLNVKAKTTIKKNGVEISIMREVTLKACQLSFKAIAEFNASMDKVNNLLRFAIKHNHWTELEVINYDWAYGDGDSLANSCIQNFDRWFYQGMPGNDNSFAIENDGSIGYYLQPDITCTPEHHDMFYDFKLESITDDSRVFERSMAEWKEKFSDKKVV